LLNFEVLEYTVLKAREYADIRFHFCVQTNLTALKPKHVAFFLQHGFGVSFSLDGQDEANAERVRGDGRNSFPDVMEALGLLRRYRLRGSSALQVVTTRNVHRLPEIARFFLENGITQWGFATVLPIGRPALLPELTPDPAQYVEGLVSVFQNVMRPYWRDTGVMPIERTLALAFAHLLQPRRLYMCHRTPCGGATNIVSVLWDGSCYPCNLSVHPSLRLGNICEHSFDGLCATEVGMRYKNRTRANLDQTCRECVFLSWCQAECPASAFAAHGDLWSRSARCVENQLLYKRLLSGLLTDEFDGRAVEALAEAGTRIV